MDKEKDVGFNVRDILACARSIWGQERLQLHEVISRLGVGFGDICRVERNGDLDSPASRAELRKELGNVIFSTIRWCDDLGFTPQECIEAAIEAQVQFVASKKPR